LQDEIKNADTLYKQYIDELSKCAIKQIPSIETLETLEPKHETIEETTLELPESPKPVKKVKASTTPIIKKTLPKAKVPALEDEIIISESDNKTPPQPQQTTPQISKPKKVTITRKIKKETAIATATTTTSNE